MSRRKKVARELPQKRRKRGLLYLKNLTTRAGLSGPVNGANLIMYWIIPENPNPKTRVENPNFWIKPKPKKWYPNSSRTQLLYPKLRNPGPGETQPFWYSNLARILLYPTRSLYRQRSRCWSCCWPPCPSSSSRSPRSLAALAHFPPHHAKELQVNEL